MNFPVLKKMDLHASVGEVMQVPLMTDLLNIPLCPSALIGGMRYKIMTFRRSVTHRGVEISSNIPIIKLKGLVVLLWISCLSTFECVVTDIVISCFHVAEAHRLVVK